MFYHLKCLNRLPPKIVRLIGVDFRKAGAITGVGFIGFILDGDNITLNETVILFSFGVMLWLYGLYFAHLVDKMKRQSQTRIRKHLKECPKQARRGGKR